MRVHPTMKGQKKNDGRATVNERRSPLPWIHPKELLYWSCGDLRLQPRLLCLIQWKRRVSSVDSLSFTHLPSSQFIFDVVDVLYQVLFFYVQDKGRFV